MFGVLKSTTATTAYSHCLSLHLRMQKWRSQDKFLSALPRPPAGPYAVEKLLPAKFAKIKSRQDALQTTFSVFLYILLSPISRGFEENGLSTATAIALTECPNQKTRPYSIPSCLWICSSDAPFVSGTIVITQRSWSTIMPAKNEKT